MEKFFKTSKFHPTIFFNGKLYSPLSFDHLFDYYPLAAIVVMYHRRKFFDTEKLRCLINNSEGEVEFGKSSSIKIFENISLFYRHPCYSEGREGKGKFEDLVKNMSRGVFVTGGLVYDYSELNEKEKNYLELFFSIPSVTYSFSFFET